MIINKEYNDYYSHLLLSDDPVSLEANSSRK